MKINLLVRDYRLTIGLERYTASLCQAFSDMGFNFSQVTSDQPFVVRAGHRVLAPFGLDLDTFFTTYPLAADANGADLTHFTAQQMATLLWTKPGLHPVIITVHDIVPFLVRKDPSQTTFRHPMDHWFDNLAMQGLKRADAIISVSEFTRQTLIDTFGIPSSCVHVVHEGVDHTVFHQKLVPDDIFISYQLDQSAPYILYVGSENPRKNLPRLLQAFTRLRHRLPDVRLIKIGSPEYLPQSLSLREQIAELGLQDSVLLIDHVSDADLALFYNFADLFVFPSLLEGFGLPPLEAMACGTPVVCSNAASLPEVVGDAAIMVDPYDIDAIAGAMQRILSDPDLAADLRQRGLERAKQFTWEKTARETIKVYERVLGREILKPE